MAQALLPYWQGNSADTEEQTMEIQKSDGFIYGPDAAEQARRGELIAETLGLRKGKDGRYKTTWGTKTPLGLYLTVARLVAEGE